MKIETFFEKFGLFADAPGAVGKMRELVLDFAISGKLISPESEWLNRPLKSLSTKIGSGATPKGGRESYFSEGVPLIRSMNVHFRGFEPTGLVYLSDEQADLLSNVIVQQNDVLLNITGASIGRVTIVPVEMDGARVNQHVTIIRPKKELLPRFLALFLASPSTQRMINEVQVGATRQALTKGMIEKFEISLPPVAEQKRIVAKVDELMALCDRLEAQQQERETRHAALVRASLARFADAPTPANLNFLFHPSYTISSADLRKSILTLAVQGKLVHQDPNDEPTKELLARIDSCRNALLKAGIVPKQKPLAEIGEGECQHSIPETWQWIRLQRASEIIDPNPSHRMPRYCDSGVPFISTENFVGREEIDFSIGKQVDEAQLEEQKKGFTIRPGSFALSRIGTIGKTRILPLERNYCMSHALVVIAPYSEDIDPKYLRMVVSSDAVQGQASQGAKSIGVPDLGMGKIRSFVVPIPPLNEQRRIMAKVEQLMDLVDALETQLAASRATAANLLSALVAELTDIPVGRVASPAPAKPVADSPRPKPQQETVATAKPVTQESTVSHRTLADLRKAAGLTQAAVAEALGLNQAYISQMETGKRSITVEQREKMFKIFGLMPK